MGIRMGLVTGSGTQTGTGIGVRRGQRWRQGWGQGQSTPQNMLCQQEIHVVLSSSLEICWAHHCLLLVCPQLCPPLQLCDCRALSCYGLGETGDGLAQGAADTMCLSQAVSQAVCLPAWCLHHARLLGQPFWHCCFVPVAVLNSLIYTGLSCYSYYVWDKETGAGGFLLLNFLVLLVIPPAQAKSQGFYSVLTVEAARGLSPISPSQLPQAGASPAEQGAADGDFCVPLPLQKLPALLPSESGQPEARVRCPEYPRGFPAASHPPPHSSSAAETVPGVKLRSGLLFALLISFLFTSHLRQCLVLL